VAWGANTYDAPRSARLGRSGTLTVMRRTPALAAALVTVTALWSLTACDSAEDAAKGVANDAACKLARSAADEAGRQASKAVDHIRTDPDAAVTELSTIRDALAAAENGVSGDVKDKLVEAKTSVEDLLGRAQDSADGAEVDTAAIDGARADLDSAIKDVKNLC
jgi:hypothetical protein